MSGLHEAAIAAGLDEIRGSGPYRAHALEAPGGLLGVPISSIDYRVINLRLRSCTTIAVPGLERRGCLVKQAYTIAAWSAAPI